MYPSLFSYPVGIEIFGSYVSNSCSFKLFLILSVFIGKWIIILSCSIFWLLTLIIPYDLSFFLFFLSMESFKTLGFGFLPLFFLTFSGSLAGLGFGFLPLFFLTFSGSLAGLGFGFLPLFFLGISVVFFFNS